MDKMQHHFLFYGHIKTIFIPQPSTGGRKGKTTGCISRNKGKIRERGKTIIPEERTRASTKKKRDLSQE